MVVRVLAFFMTVGHINRDYCKRSTTDAMQYVTAKYCNKLIVPPRVAGLGCLSRDGVVSKRMNGSNVFLLRVFFYICSTLYCISKIKTLSSETLSQIWTCHVDRPKPGQFHSTDDRLKFITVSVHR